MSDSHLVMHYNLMHSPRIASALLMHCKHGNYALLTSAIIMRQTIVETN